MKKTLSILLGCWLFSGSISTIADEYGMIMDLEGKINILRGNKTLKGDLGDLVEVGDRLILEKKSRATIISYLDCSEIIMTGALEVEVTWEKLKTKNKKQLTKGRKMPVCYSHDELNTSDSGVIGGLVLRGVDSDPTRGLRIEFDKGLASNSILITLIMHDLANGEPEKALPYFKALRNYSPNSAFIAKVTPYFAKP